MKTLAHYFSQALHTRTLGGTWVAAWTLLCCSLVVALYLSFAYTYRLILTIDPTIHVSTCFWVTTWSVLALLNLVFLAGVVAAYQFASLDRTVRHALTSIKEGELGTRIDLSAYEGCEELEKAFNDTMEVVHHRIEVAEA